jgi:hypothetical protein
MGKAPSEEDVSTFLYSMTFMLVVVATMAFFSPNEKSDTETTRENEAEAPTSLPLKPKTLQQRVRKTKNLVASGSKVDLRKIVELHDENVCATDESTVLNNARMLKEEPLSKQTATLENLPQAAKCPHSRVWLFAPNIIGYIRLTMTVWGLSFAFTSPMVFLIAYCVSMLLVEFSLFFRILIERYALLQMTPR